MNLASRRAERKAKTVKKQKYYDAFADVSHDIVWEDGEKIYVGGNEYVFVRSGVRDGDGGVWRATGGALGATASW
jgi:hypothetical protein